MGDAVDELVLQLRAAEGKVYHGMIGGDDAERIIRAGSARIQREAYLEGTADGVESCIGTCDRDAVKKAFTEAARRYGEG